MSAEQGNVDVIREALPPTDETAMYVAHVRPSEVHAALDRLVAALERAERERADLLAQWADYRATTEDVIEAVEQERDRFLAGNQKLLDGQIRLAKRAEKAERALAEIADYIEAEFREGDKPYQVAIIARAALRPSEEASDE